MNRLVFLLHRYLGIAVGLVIAIWCVSGIVMMYVEYPELGPEDEVRALEPIALGGCCARSNAIETAYGVPLDGLRVEMMAGRPVLRLEATSGERMTFDLRAGEPVGPLDASAADAVAASFAQVFGLDGYGDRRRLQRDQWTVYGAYDVHRPLYRYSGNDAAGTEWYVSSRTGEIVQFTNASERFWNWLGAVPHWLYPTLLRQHTALWAQVVIWLTIVGTFLTLLGIYVGTRQFRARRSGRYSPYRGAALWHHYAGLVFGALMLTWLVSGFFSMNPWGALESRDFSAEIARQQGAGLVLDRRLLDEIEGLRASGLPGGTVRIEAHVAAGERFLIGSNAAGERQRLNEGFDDVVPFTEKSLHEAGERMRPAVAIAEEGWITTDDAYYYSHHETRPLPVYRIVYADGERFYLDPLTAGVAYAVDGNRRLYRWLHYGLHRGDFTAWLRERPVWDLFMIPLLIGVTLSGLTGTWMGFRRVLRWFRLRNTRATLRRTRFDWRPAG